MPKNKGKGGKNRRRGKNENEDMKRELIYKDDGQSYAQVTRILGNGYVEAFCFDTTGGKKRVCHIRGKLRKKQWINQGDIILIGLRDYQDDKADVLMRYTPDEARKLKREQQIPDNINIVEQQSGADDETGVIFDDQLENDESSDDAMPLPKNNNKPTTEANLSSNDSNDEENEEEPEFFNPNRLPVKDSGKGARNNKRHLWQQEEEDSNVIENI